MKKPDIKTFGEGAIHTRCDAFMDDSFIVPHIFEDKTVWKAGQEFSPDYSCSPELPEVIAYEGEHMQGTFNFVSDSKAELYLACSYFREIGQRYFVFFSHTVHTTEKYGEQDHFDWCIWTPNTKHLNKRKKEEV